MNHVIAEKHEGQTALDNLALSYTMCKRRKGSGIGSADPETGNLMPLFNPRPQWWSGHFMLGAAYIVGLTDVGRTTAAFLRLNAFGRLLERDALIRAGRYPPHRLMR